MSPSERWYRTVQWIPAINLILVPICCILAAPWIPLHRGTLCFVVVYTFNSGLCITAGYHRLWSHKSYQAHWSLRLYLAIFGAGAMEGPIIWWAREHRLHHRYTDTAEDPYSIQKGFMHAHMLWMIFKQPRRTRRVDLSDLEADSVVMWQRRHFSLLAIGMGWVFPTVAIGIIFQDWAGGFIYGALGKMVLTHQGTFCINSLAHYLGDRPYDARTTPRDNLLVALVTFGEGYHNFHHIFPSDYRNGVRWYQYDCTKWAIALWEKIGLAYGLNRVDRNEIERARLQESQKGLAEKLQALPQAELVQTLPMITASDYRRRVKDGQLLIAVEGGIHDVSGFIADHPGGVGVMKAFLGKDATAAFNMGIYSHSRVARNVLDLTRVALLREGVEMVEDQANRATWRKTNPVRYLESS